VNYNELIESKNNDLFDFIKGMLNINVGVNKFRVKDFIVNQPQNPSNYCVCMNMTYSYIINVIVECYEGNFKDKTQTLSFELPKMVENNFLVHSGSGFYGKYRTPITVGNVRHIIRGESFKIFCPMFSIFMNALTTSKGVKLNPRLGIYRNELETYDLSSYLISTGADELEVRKYIKDGLFERITPPNEIAIPDYLVEKFSNKYFQLTGQKLTTPMLNGSHLFELIKAYHSDPELFSMYTPFDIEFLSDFDILISDLRLQRKLIMAKITFQAMQNITKSNTMRLNINYFSRLIASHYMAKSEVFRTIQVSSETNAATNISQSRKVYFVVKNKITKKLNKTDLKYNEDFIGIVCPFKTPEGNLVNLGNELARHVDIQNRVPYLKVLTKDLKVISISYLEYFSSRILSQSFYNYETHQVVPVKGMIDVLYHGKYSLIKCEENLDQFDYVRVDESSNLAYNTSLIPFVNHCDSVRMAMATKMIDQAQPVEGAELPPVYSGAETEIYNNSDFNIKSEVSGEVTGIYNEFIKITTFEGDKILKIPEPTITANHTYNRHKIIVKVGDIISKGTIVAESNSFKDGVLAIKVPVRVLYTNYFGFDHEDGMIMREGVRKLFTHKVTKSVDIVINKATKSIFDRDLIINKSIEKSINSAYLSDIRKLNEFGIPNVGDIVNEGQLLCARLEELDPNTDDLAKLSNLSSKEKLMRTTLTKVPFGVTDGKIIKVEVNINPLTNYLKPIRDHYEEISNKQLAELTEFIGKSATVFNRSKFNFNKYSGVIHIEIEYLKLPEIADKFANFYGSKGTETKFVPDDEMPRSATTGEVYDVIFSPDSVWSRKNTGQLPESYLGEVARTSKRLGVSYIENKKFSKLKELLNTIHVTDRFTKYSDKDLIKYDNDNKKYYHIKVASIDNKYNLAALEKIEKVTGVSLDLKEYVLLPKENRVIEEKLEYGITSMMRLHFDASDKLRSTSNIYTGDDLVLGPGKYRSGGQKLGEINF